MDFDREDDVSFIVKGDVPTIKNNMLRSRSGRMFYKPEIPAYFKSFGLQTPRSLKKNLSGDLRLTLTIIRKDRRKDCANILDTIQDALQKSGVIKNDRDIVICSYDGTQIDKNNPRVIINVEKIDV